MSGPRPERSYNLLVRSPLTSMEIALETPCASGWQTDHMDALAAATEMRLVPVVPGFPMVSVDLRDGRQWVYYRKIAGRVGVRDLDVRDRNVRHFFGWKKGDVEHVVQIGPNGELTVL